MYDILSLCAYLSVFCRLHVSLSQDYFIRFYYVYVYRNDLYLQKSKPFAFELPEQIIKIKCSIFVLSLLIAESNTYKWGRWFGT